MGPTTLAAGRGFCSDRPGPVFPTDSDPNFCPLGTDKTAWHRRRSHSPNQAEAGSLRTRAQAPWLCARRTPPTRDVTHGGCHPRSMSPTGDVTHTGRHPRKMSPTQDVTHGGCHPRGTSHMQDVTHGRAVGQGRRPTSTSHTALTSCVTGSAHENNKGVGTVRRDGTFNDNNTRHFTKNFPTCSHQRLGETTRQHAHTGMPTRRAGRCGTLYVARRDLPSTPRSPPL